MNILNLAAYRFVALDDLPALRERVLERATALALKGTVLLAPEGINLFLADGAVAGQEVFHVHLHVLPRNSGDGFSISAQRHQPDRAELDTTAALIRAVL